MALYFDPQTGLTPDEIETVREQVRQAFVLAFTKAGQPNLNTEPETPVGQLIDSLTAAIVKKDNEILYLASMFDPLTAEGIWQDALGHIYFMERQRQRASVASVTCTGLQGTVIAEGAIIQSTSAEATQWRCLDSVTIPAGGSVTAEFACTTPGPISAAAGTLTHIVTVTPGWDTASNADAATVGEYIESRVAFEQRRAASVAKNARGSLASIYGALASVQGVVDLCVLENTTNVDVTQYGVTIPGHSIYCSIVGGAAADIAEAIYQHKDAGCGTAGNTTVTHTAENIPGNPVYSYLIERPASLAISVQVTLAGATVAPDTVTAVQDAILADFSGQAENPRVGLAQTLYASRFFCPVREIANEPDIVSIKVKRGSGPWKLSVDINADEEPTLDRANISVIAAGE